MRKIGLLSEYGFITEKEGEKAAEEIDQGIDKGIE